MTDQLQRTWTRSLRLARTYTRDRAAIRSEWCSPRCPSSVRAFGTLGIKKGDKVVVAMSGGVDSSVSLSLLASHTLPSSLPPSILPKLSFTYGNPSMSNSEFSQSMLNPARDLDVSAVFMRNWSPLTNEVDHDDWEVDCAWEKDWEDVQIVCKQFGVPVKLIDLSTPYWLNVFEPAITAWQAGRTPNPDVSCNKEIKFGRLLEETFPPSSPDSSVQGSNPQGWLVTGHYASTKKTSTGRTRLIRPVDPAKDQTYYLSSCSESQLSRALFPLENLRKKDEVREIARAFKLGVAEREESMGVCFVGEKRGKFGNFVSQYTTPDPAPGHLVSPTGTILGTHNGLWHYTIGQRARLPGMNDKWFVARKDAEKNEIVVVPGSDHPALDCLSLTTPASHFRWVWENEPPAEIDTPQGLTARCQVRHRMTDVAVNVIRKGTDLVVMFDRPEKAVAAGQVVALFDKKGECCLGSGVIESTVTAE